MSIRPEHLHGHVLYGNDLSGLELEQWYRDEENGFYELIASGQEKGEVVKFDLDTRAMNQFHGSFLPAGKFETCVAIGCADGSDLLALGREIIRVIAIEPSKQWWASEHGGVPFDYVAPTLKGTIDLPDSSVDLVVALGALHHVATVECVVHEMVRILRPGGALMIREPITTMGDFRYPRPGMTKNERGIPFEMMKNFLSAAGARELKTVPCSFQAIKKLAGKFGIEGHNVPFLVQADHLLSKAFMFNARYWRPSLMDKIAPTSAVYFATK